MDIKDVKEAVELSENFNIDDHIDSPTLNKSFKIFLSLAKEVIMGKKRPGNKNSCGKCSSTLVYFRVKTKERVCRQCGHVEKMK